MTFIIQTAKTVVHLAMFSKDVRYSNCILIYLKLQVAAGQMAAAELSNC